MGAGGWVADGPGVAAGGREGRGEGSPRVDQRAGGMDACGRDSGMVGVGRPGGDAGKSPDGSDRMLLINYIRRCTAMMSLQIPGSFGHYSSDAKTIAS